MPLLKSMDTETRSPGDSRSGSLALATMFVPSGLMNFFDWNYGMLWAGVVPSFQQKKSFKPHFGEIIRIAQGINRLDG